MRSARQRRSRPIESVELRVSIRADRATCERVKQAFPEATVRAGSCELKVDGASPSEVAEKAREMLEKLRGLVAPAKDFK